MQVISGILFTLLLIGLLVLGVVYTGSYDVRATTEHTQPVLWLLHKTRHQAIKRNTYSLRDHNFSGDDAAISRGALAYDQMCAGCHGAPGKQPFAAAQGMYPAPESLEDLAQSHSAKEIFYVAKFGLKMTGMPAWSHVAEDSTLWDVAAFVTESPGIDAAAYYGMINPAVDPEPEDDPEAPSTAG